MNVQVGKSVKLHDADTGIMVPHTGGAAYRCCIDQRNFAVYHGVKIHHDGNSIWATFKAEQDHILNLVPVHIQHLCAENAAAGIDADIGIFKAGVAILGQKQVMDVGPVVHLAHDDLQLQLQFPGGPVQQLRQFIRVKVLLHRIRIVLVAAHCMDRGKGFRRIRIDCGGI